MGIDLQKYFVNKKSNFSIGWRAEKELSNILKHWNSGICFFHLCTKKNSKLENERLKKNLKSLKNQLLDYSILVCL